MTGSFVAVDLGATSGRVMHATVTSERIELTEVHRFANEPVERDGSLRWDLTSLLAEIEHGLSQLADTPVDSIGVDSWAVDYALIGRDGTLLDQPYHYRDQRNARGVELVHGRVDHAGLYARTGLQHLPFNTVFQLAVDDQLDSAERVLMIPDAVNWHLTGVQRCERTNASTTALLDPATGEWHAELFDVLALSPDIFAPLVDPGETVGQLTAEVVERIGWRDQVPVVAVGSHDTASAVHAISAGVGPGPTTAYLSCGTWGLVGVEIAEPITSDAARQANFTNERAVSGGVRLLHNVMGLWLLSESIRTWEAGGRTIDLERLIAEAAELGPPPLRFNTNDERFLPPGDMPARIRDYLSERAQLAPRTPDEVTRLILESLAADFATAAVTAGQLADKPVEAIRIVGGGSRNPLLCQLTADHSGLAVIAGPVEATALGNVMVQAEAAGGLGAADLTRLVDASFEVRRFEPRR